MSAEQAIGTSSKPGSVDLTPAASEALDLNADLFRRQVLLELSRRSRRSPGYRVRVSDVQLAVDQLAADNTRDVKSVPRVTRLAIGLTGATLGFQLILQLAGSAQSWVIGGAALLAGISTGTTIVVLVQERRRQRRVKALASIGFLDEIQTLEWSARQAAGLTLGVNAENLSLRRILTALELLEIWTPEDSQTFRKLLALRNSLVHEDSRALSPEDVSFGLTQVARLAHLIQRREKAIEEAPRKIFSYSSRSTRMPSMAFEERVTHALQEASFEVMAAQSDHGYDLLVETSDGSAAIIVKYRREGSLGISDIVQVTRKGLPSIPAIIITNMELSDTAARYLASEEVMTRGLAVVTWSEEKSDADLAESVRRAIVELPASLA